MAHRETTEAGALQLPGMRRGEASGAAAAQAAREELWRNWRPRPEWKAIPMNDATQAMLAAQLTAQVEQFDAIYAALDRGLPYDDGTGYAQDPDDALHEVPLEVTVRRHITVLLSCGGPNVAIEAFIDQDGAIIDARLVGHWGSALIERHVSKGSSVFRALETYSIALSA